MSGDWKLGFYLLPHHISETRQNEPSAYLQSIATLYLFV